MAFDASVISAIPDMAPNPVKAKADAYTLSNLADTNTLNKMKLSEAKTQQQEEAKYKEVLKGHDWSTDKGASEAAEALTQAGLPERAMQFMKERQAIAGGALDIQAKQIANRVSQQEILDSAMDGVHRQIDSYIQQNPNATPAMVNAKTQELIVPAMDQLEQQHSNEPDIVQAIHRYKQGPGALTYDGLNAAMASSKSGLARLKEMHEEQKGARDERAQNTRDEAQAVQAAGERRKQAAEDFKEKEAKDKQEKNDKADDATADLIGTYRYRPPTGIGSRSPESRILMEKVLKKYPNYDQTRYDEKRSAMLAFGTGKQGDAVRALNNAIAHMDVLSELTDALENKDVKRINYLGNLWSQETGKPAPTNFNAAKGIVTEEIGKAVLPGGGIGQERLEIAANADKSQSGPVLKGVMKTWKRLLSGQMLGLKRQYKQATGLDNFEEMMSPQALRELEQQGPPPSDGAAPPQWNPSQPGVGFWKH